MKKYLYLILFVAISNFSFAQPGGYYLRQGLHNWTGSVMSSSGVGTTQTHTVQATSTDPGFIVEWDNGYNKWQSHNINANQVSQLNFMAGGNPPNSTIQSGVTSGNFYTFNIDALDYSNRQFVLMETSSSPIDISSVSSFTSNVSPNIDITITVNLSGSKSTEEKVYVRYTSDNWTSWDVAQVVGIGNFTSGVATIPASVNTANSTVEYYVYSTTVSATSSSNHDLITLRFNNNSNSNYSYTVSSQNIDLSYGSIDPGDIWDSHIEGSYAYLANGTYNSGTISIVDISNLSNPTEVGSLSTHRAYDIFYKNDYLYVADHSEGLKIIDVSDKTDPTLVSSIWSGTSTSLHYYTEVNVVGDYAYVAAYKNFYIYDVSDVNSPSLVSTYSCASGCNDFVIDGNYIYLANSFYGLQILDVSDKTSPSLTDSYDNGYLNGVSKNGNYIYGSDNGDYLDIYDVSDVNNISLVSSINCSTLHDGSSMIGYGNDNDGNYVYMGVGSAGVQVFNVSDPNNPSFHAYIRTSSAKECEIYGDYLFVSDRVSGLKIYDTSALKTVSRWTNSGGDNLWSNTSNWSTGSIPTSSDDVNILNGNSITVDVSDAVAASINIVSGGTLTINSNARLLISNDFSNAGTTHLNSTSTNFSVLKLSSSSRFSGDIVYNRYVNTQGTDEWDLIGSPVDGLSISSFVTTNSSPLATSGSTYAVGVYDNSDSSWTNYTSSTVGAAGNFDIGKGYQMATSSGATMAFTGTIATTDQTQSIVNNAGSGGRRWNLVANPYPSYLNANTNAHASNNFLSVNSGVIDSNYLALYGYDADGSGYTIYNNTSGATYIAPGQAFFIAAASSSAADLSFTEAMQTTTGGDDFVAGRLANNTSSEFYLKLYEDEDFIGGY